MKIRPVRSEFHTDGHTDERTDMMKLIVAFRNCADRPKNVCLLLISGKNTRSVWVLWAVFMVHTLRRTTCLQASSSYCGNVDIVAYKMRL
jgi:hypothetical protein